MIRYVWKRESMEKSWCFQRIAANWLAMYFLKKYMNLQLMFLIEVVM